jgi:hypothetical protein
VVRDDLESAVEGLFRAFDSAPLNDRVDYCDHCVSPEQVEALLVTPLRQLTPDQLGPLLFKAMSTWGDVAYFKHFLPRLLELVAGGAMEDLSYPSFLPSRLACCWSEGTEEERNAVEGFLRAWWSATISRGDSPCMPRDVLEVIDGCGLPVKPYLDVWSMDTGEAAVGHLAAFIEDWVLISWGSDRLVIAIDRWLGSDVPSVLLKQVSDPALARELTEATDLLAFYRALPKAERTYPPA